MGKSLEELRREAQAANDAYQAAIGKDEEKLRKIASQQDEGIRPKFERNAPRDEFGNPIKLDKFGNPERRLGQKISAAHARPVYTPPMRSPHSEPGAPPPDIDFQNNGTWEETRGLWFDLVDVLLTLEREKLTAEEREEYVQQLVPSLLDRMAASAPRIDCAFEDGPMGKGAWRNLVSKYQFTFNPSKSIERSKGTMRSRVAPKFLPFATDGANWLFRKCPQGIPEIPQNSKKDKKDVSALE